MRRLVTGWRLARGALAVVAEVPVLLVPGLLHALCLVAVCGGALAVGAGEGRGTTAWLLLAAGLFVTTAVGTVCAAVVVSVTADRLNGGTAGLRDGWRSARSVLPALLGWSLLHATVGTALRQLEERLGPVGRWVTGALGVLFAVATLLVVPLIVLERRPPRAALRRSAALFRQRWGEAVVGDTGLGALLGLGLLAAVLLVVCPLLTVGITPALAALSVIVGLFLATSSTATAVLSAALHRVAVGGDGGPFGDLEQLFAPPVRHYQPSYAAPHGQWDAS